MGRYLAFILIFISQSPITALGEGTDRRPLAVEYLIDLSRSMNEPVRGEATRASEALESLRGTVQKLKVPNLAAVRVYGRRYSLEDQEQSCIDTELYAPFQSGSEVAETLSRLGSLAGGGYTPLAYALSMAPEDFRGIGTEYVRSLVIITDGIDTCGGNVYSALQGLQNQGFQIELNIIGIFADKKTKEYLARLAQLGAGTFHDLTGPEKLTDTLMRINTSKGIKGDLGGASDAPGELTPQVRDLSEGEYQGTLSYYDRGDVFCYAASPHEKVLVQVRLSAPKNGTVEVAIYESSGKTLFTGNARHEAELLETVEAPVSRSRICVAIENSKRLNIAYDLVLRSLAEFE